MAKNTIVIFEANSDSAKQITQVLEGQEYRCFVFEDTAQFMKCILVHQLDLAAVLVNISVTPFGVAELCNAIRSLDILKHVPIVLLANDLTPEDCVIGFEAGCVDVITYPVDANKLIARLKHAISFWALFCKQERKATKAHAVAQDSMEYSNYLADIVRFSDRCSAIYTFDTLAEAVFELTQARGLNVSLMFLDEQVHYFSSTPSANPIEREMMLMVFGAGGGGESGNRFQVFNNRLFACFDHSILLIKNCDEETLGQMRDLMASLMNIVDARAKVIINTMQQHDQLKLERQKNLKAFDNAFARIDESFASQTENVRNTIDIIESELSVNLAALDLGDYMEGEITRIVVGYFEKVVDQVQGNRSQLGELLKQMNEYLVQELGADDSASDHLKRDESR